jgi:hypothetical protein
MQVLLSWLLFGKIRIKFLCNDVYYCEDCFNRYGYLYTVIVKMENTIVAVQNVWKWCGEFHVCSWLLLKDMSSEVLVTNEIRVL